MGRLKEHTIGILTAVALVWGSFLALNIHDVLRQRQLQRPDAYPAYTDLISSLAVSAAMFIGQLVFRSIFVVFARGMVKKKPRWSHTVWNLKVTRCCDAVFKCCYYSVITTYMYFALRDEPWTPPVLGGTGNTRLCWTDYPFQPVPLQLRRCYVIAIGYHFSEVVTLMVDKRHPDFREMLLHHIVTCYLVSFSYLLNYVRVGSLVLFLHGATDIFIYASKAFVDTPNLRIITVSYFALVVAYAWFRIYVFPLHVMRSAWVESIQESGTQGLYSWGFLNFALCVLLLLHMYWFGLVVKMGITFRRTGEARDLISNLSSIDMHQTKKDS